MQPWLRKRFLGGKQLGAVLVDIGGGTTNCIYDREVFGLPLSAYRNMSVIAVGLRTPLAKLKIKEEYGCVLPSLMPSDRD